MIKAVTEFIGQVSIIDLIVCVGGVLVLAWWLLKTSLGTNSLANSLPRRIDMPWYLALIPPLFWFLTMWVLGLVKEKEFAQISGWQEAFIDNVVMCLGAAPAAVTGLVIAQRHFARRLKGLGLNFRTIPKDICVAFINLFAVWPVVLAAILVVTLAGKLLVGPEFQIPAHEELKLITSYPQWQVRFLIIITAAAVVPIVEELIFRGLLQTVLRSYVVRPWPAIILTSLIFVAFHEKPQHWPALFVLSLCFGYAYEKSGSLFRSIFLHAMFNGLSVFAALGQ